MSEGIRRDYLNLREYDYKRFVEIQAESSEVNYVLISNLFIFFMFVLLSYFLTLERL